MGLWRKTFGTTTRPHSTTATRVPDGRGNAGEYQRLYEYLRDRYANCVVLTFAEIEDLLGFSLPESARLELEWWNGASPTGGRSAQAHSWTLAGRTVTVNTTAQSVVFDRGLQESIDEDSAM